MYTHYKKTFFHWTGELVLNQYVTLLQSSTRVQHCNSVVSLSVRFLFLCSSSLHPHYTHTIQCCLYFLYPMLLSTLLGCFPSTSCLFAFHLGFIPIGAECIPSSCWECQQDVLCHHRPVQDQQHVSLQPSSISASLPKGSSDTEGQWTAHTPALLSCLWEQLFWRTTFPWTKSSSDITH